GFQDLESWFLQIFYPQLLSSPQESQSATDQREFIAYQDQMTPVANAVRSRLVRTLQHSHNNWDGFYSSGEGYGGSTLLVSTDGFLLTSYGCTGWGDRMRGTVVVDGDILYLRPIADPHLPAVKPADTRYALVTYGRRRYLIPPDEVSNFCAT